jgi:hypothetical protein
VHHNTKNLFHLDGVHVTADEYKILNKQFNGKNFQKLLSAIFEKSSWRDFTEPSEDI